MLTPEHCLLKGFGVKCVGYELDIKSRHFLILENREGVSSVSTLSVSTFFTRLCSKVRQVIFLIIIIIRNKCKRGSLGNGCPVTLNATVKY